MKGLILAALVLATVLLGAHNAGAQDVGLFSMERASLAAGYNYAWFGADQPLELKNEQNVGVYAAYNLIAPRAGESGMRVSLVGSSAYGFENKFYSSSVGLRVTLWNGARR